METGAWQKRLNCSSMQEILKAGLFFLQKNHPHSNPQRIYHSKVDLQIKSYGWGKLNCLVAVTFMWLWVKNAKLQWHVKNFLMKIYESTYVCAFPLNFKNSLLPNALNDLFFKPCFTNRGFSRPQQFETSVLQRGKTPLVLQMCPESKALWKTRNKEVFTWK